jgi:hypothetical protein
MPNDNAYKTPSTMKKEKNIILTNNCRRYPSAQRLVVLWQRLYPKWKEQTGRQELINRNAHSMAREGNRVG